MHDAEQCRHLARAPVFDGAPRAAMRTFPAMITISVGLGLNQLRLHRGENGLALGQAQPNGLGGNHICRPVAGDHFVSLSPVVSVSSNKIRHFMQFPRSFLDQNSIAPPTLRRSHLERSNLIASDRLHMAAIERHRDRLNGWWAGQWLGCQRLLLQSGAHPKGPAACRLDRGRLVQRKELRHQSRRAAIGGQAPHFEENALVFWGASIRHYLGQRAHDPARGDSTAAGIEARRLDFQLSRAPVLDGTTGPAMRTFSPMLTISIDLGLNQLGLHGGKNGFALGQSQTDRVWRRRICRWSPVNASARARLPLSAPAKPATSFHSPGQ